MTNIGWIKLHRNLRNSFSSDKKLNIELWMLYVFLAEQAAWDDFDGLKRGFVKIKARQIQEEIFPNMYIKRIRHLISVLRRQGHIKTTAADHDNKEGLLYEICQYDGFSGESDEKSTKLTLDSPSTVLRQITLDKCSESLIKNHDELTWLDSPSTVLRQSACSLFIEERNKEIKEGLNTLPEHPAGLGDDIDPIIIDEPIKETKKPRKEKTEGKSVPVINAYKEAYQARYAMEPLISVKQRSQACKIAKEIPAENIEAFIWFYVGHPDPFYTKQLHPLGLCVLHIEKIYTEFRKNDYVTKEYAESFVKNRSKRFRI